MKTNDFGTAAELTAANPAVPSGVLMVERDTGRSKWGTNGTTRWNDLPYLDPVQTKALAADQSNSTLTPADVTALRFPVVAGGTYIFEFHLMSHAAATTTGLQVAVNGPASPTYVRCTEVAGLSLTAAFFVGVDTYEELFGNTSSSATAGSPLPLLLSGCLVNGVNAGTFALRFASEVDTSAVTIQRGSWGRLTRVA